MHGRTNEQLYPPLTDIFRPPHDAPTLTEVANEINDLSDVPKLNLDPRVHEALSMKKYANAAMMLRDTPGGRDPIATKNANTTTADAFYLILKRHAEDIETKQEFEAQFPVDKLEQTPTLNGFESMHAMSTQLFEEVVEQTPLHELPATLPEEGYIASPIEVGHIIDICRVRELFDKAWQTHNLDERQALLEQASELSSGTDISLAGQPELPKAQVMNKFFGSLAQHDLVFYEKEHVELRTPYIKESVRSLFDTSELITDSNLHDDLRQYAEKINHFIREYAREIGYTPTGDANIDTPKIRELVKWRSKKSLRYLGAKSIEAE